MIKLYSIYLINDNIVFLLPSLRISFTIGIDATKLIPCWQFSTTHCALVGGAYPNHMRSLEGLGKDEVEKLIQEHREGQHGPLAEEVKVAVLVFQAVPPGMSPYFVLVGRPQTNNESSEFTFEGKYMNCSH